jgi:hypothetical protein
MTSYKIWYMRPRYFADGIMGYDFCQGAKRLPDVNNLEATHIKLKEVDAANLEAVFLHMQGENWSPNGKARSLIDTKGLRHTSMSIGDIVVTGNEVYTCDIRGFKLLGEQNVTPENA